jgi:hypothetical protein
MTKKQQIVVAMRQLIADGHWDIGESVGDLWKLQEDSLQLFGVQASWGTIREAEQVLVDEGVLSDIQQGMPTRVIAIPSHDGEDTSAAPIERLRTGSQRVTLDGWTMTVLTDGRARIHHVPEPEHSLVIQALYPGPGPGNVTLRLASNHS